MQDAETIHFGGDPIQVHWDGNFLDYGGFARMNRSFVIGLSNRNVMVKPHMQSYIHNINEATFELFKNLEKTPVSDKAPKVFGVSMPMDMSHSGKKIIFTMMETSHSVHKDYAEKLNMFDEVWVPTAESERVLRNGGVMAPIYQIPLGVDATRYHPDTKPLNFGKGLKDFRFISVFKWSYRKGPDLLLKAYMEEFSADDNVSLIMVTRALNVPDEVGNKLIMDDFEAVKSSVGKSEEELPHVAVYQEPVSERKMPAMYAACNAFVLLSRGEGFGLPYCEASCAGLPVIGTHCTAQVDYLKHDNSFLVEPEDFVVSSLNSWGELSKMAKMSHFYEDQQFPLFEEKSWEQAKKQMRFVFENEELAKQKNEKLRSFILENYNWDKAINLAHERILNSQ
jgi:glycosyltransferase involved in cell wall biosynthesis